MRAITRALMHPFMYRRLATYSGKAVAAPELRFPGSRLTHPRNGDRRHFRLRHAVPDADEPKTTAFRPAIGKLAGDLHISMGSTDDPREAAWFAVHDALPAYWDVGPVTFDPARGLFCV